MADTLASTFVPDLNPTRYKDQVIMVTGAALKGNIGFGVVERYLQEGAQAVHVFDYNKEALAVMEKEFNDKRVFSHTVDIADRNAVYGGYKEILKYSDKLDVVVHCAAIIGPNGEKFPIEALPDEDFEKCIHVNFMGTYYIVKGAIQAMMPKEYGRIMVVASIAGRDGNPFMAAYSSSKAGTIGLVRSIGHEMSKRKMNITVNAVAPVTIPTPMVMKGTDEDRVAFMKSMIPMGELGTVEGLADLIATFTTPAKYFINGQCLDYSGGRNKH